MGNPASSEVERRSKWSKISWSQHDTKPAATPTNIDIDNQSQIGHSKQAGASTRAFASPRASLLCPVHLAEPKERRLLVDRLREVGLDDYVELPQIAVMGDTSCGKSSLLSTISGVTFPSSDDALPHASHPE